MTTVTDRPRPRPELLAIDAYVPGKSSVSGLAKVHKLSSNESPLGPSPAALAAFKAQADQLAFYPDGGAWDLRGAIAARHGLDPARILTGNGSDELLGLIAHAYLAPGDEGLYSQYGFLEYPIVIRAAGGVPVVAPEENYTTNVDALLAKVGPKTRLVFLANPNNPTGTYIPYAEVKRLHAALPGHVILVLDAAYAEYVQRSDYASGVELVSDFHNVVMTRTFSKIYGLAALRIGWAYAPAEIVDVLNRIRPPFNVNSAAQAAGVAALADEAHTQAAVQHNIEWLAWLTAELTALGFPVLPSVGNFVLIEFPESGPAAAEAYEYLNSEGFILRPVRGYGLPNHLRLTVGDEEANRGLIAALKRFVEGGKRA